MAPSHEPYFTMRGYMSKQDSHDLKAIWSGPHRVIVSIISGFRNGPDFEAEILPDGGDCILHDPSTGAAHLDVQTMARTADGHSTYIHYGGILKIDEKLLVSCHGAPTPSLPTLATTSGSRAPLWRRATQSSSGSRTHCGLGKADCGGRQGFGG